MSIIGDVLHTTVEEIFEVSTLSKNFNFNIQLL